MEHMRDSVRHDLEVINAETGEYAAYSRPGNEYTSKPGYFRNPNNLAMCLWKHGEVILPMMKGNQT